MKNIYKSLSYLLIFLAPAITAQEKHCGTDIVMKKRMEASSLSKKAHEKLQSFTQHIDYKKSIAGKMLSAPANYTIPVVFHILHT
ncbi:MAG: hypothetical protein K0S32_4231, partial [Bacteroidetes bacterium]|nr:hypothetical protein [Bacteroidota bacterium]